MSQTYAFVHGVVYAFVGFAYDRSEMLFVLFYHIAASIGAAAIDNNIFKVIICLADDALDSLFKAFFVIVVNGDDRKRRHNGCICRFLL